MYNMYEDDEMSLFEQLLVDAICEPIDNSEEDERTPQLVLVWDDDGVGHTVMDWNDPRNPHLTSEEAPEE